MAIINCPECNKEISNKAEACPHCGLPASYFSDRAFQSSGSIVGDTSGANFESENILGTWEFDLNLIFESKTYISRKNAKKFCDQRGITGKDQDKVYEKIDQWNNGVISLKLSELKDYFDHILDEIDPAINLDEEQRRAILTDEEYSLIIAGAGAGKTTTMAAKVKYLVDIKRVDPDKIVVISYTNKAIDELKERVNSRLKIPVKISTFHAFGYEILRKSSSTIPVVNFNAYVIIYDFIKSKVLDDARLLRKLVLFLGYYFDLPKELNDFKTLKEYSTYKANLDYETLKSRLGEYNTKTAEDRNAKRNRTIEGEFLRSSQEVQIANFLYLNCIEYEYEKPYQHAIEGSRKIYTPDFYIQQGERVCYIEHYGITENYHSNLYTPKEVEKYSRSIIDKRKLHKSNNTTLIETWSHYNDERPLLGHLKEELEAHGFVLQPRSDDEVYRTLVETAQDKYVYRLIYFTIRFIDLYKTCGYGLKEFSELRRKTKNVRINLYLEIAEEIFAYYDEELRRQNKIDFADMINDATQIIKQAASSKERPSYSYIIIDEFQDIAKQRFNLAKALADITGARVAAVGDDWQSIYSFAGSDITLFMKFLQIMGEGKELFISNTYRNAQELIDIAGSFVLRNSKQIRKNLKSSKHLKNPIQIECYDDLQLPQKNWINKIEATIGKIVHEYGQDKTILIIGRYNFDRDRVIKSDLFDENGPVSIICRKYPKVKIDFMSVHSSKGLGYDNVIVSHMNEGKYGFPSQIGEDPIMRLVMQDDTSIVHAEERRLFYVALTRTKNRVYLIAPINKPSRFLLELINEYKIEHDPALNMSLEERINHPCPVCGFPLFYENNKNYGLQLYICSNEPELCGFMTNDRKYPNDIYKCPKCKDGFMIVKKNSKTEDRFYGCTNYQVKGIECKNQAQIVIKRGEH